MCTWFRLPSCVSVCAVGMTVAVGVGVLMGAGVIMGRMLALGVALLPGMDEGLPAAPVTGVGLMLAVGGSLVLELKHKVKFRPTPDESAPDLILSSVPSSVGGRSGFQADLSDVRRSRRLLRLCYRMKQEFEKHIQTAPLLPPLHPPGIKPRTRRFSLYLGAPRLGGLVSLFSVSLLLLPQLPQLALLPAHSSLELRLERRHPDLKFVPLLLQLLVFFTKLLLSS